MAPMVKVQANTTATFFYVTDARSVDRTDAARPDSGSVDSSGQVRWWYVPQPSAPRSAR